MSSFSLKQKPPYAGKRWLSSVSSIVLLACALTMALWNLHHFKRKPFGMDVMSYAVIGQEMLAGRDLYSDLWDHKPPATYVTFAAAEGLLGYNWFALYALHTTALIITLFGIYAATKSIGGQAAGLWAAALWVLLSGNIPLEGHDPNTEIFLNACRIWAFALFVRPSGKAFAIGRSLATGAIFALASLYKPIAIISAALLSAVHIALPVTQSDRRRAFYEVCISAFVGAFAWLAVIGYFTGRGRFEDFRDAVFTYNRFYSGNIFVNIIAPIVRGRDEVVPEFLIPLAIIASLGIVLSLSRDLRAGALLLVFICATWGEIAAPGHFYDHYYLLWIPPLLVGAGWALGLAAQRWVKQPWSWLPYSVGAVLAIILAVHAVPSFRRILAGDYSEMMAPREAVTKPMAQKIDALLAPDESFFVLAAAPGLYFWSGRRPPTGVFFEKHLNGPLAQPLNVRVISDLERKPPELIITRRDKLPEMNMNDPLTKLISESYQLFSSGTKDEPFDMFARRGGKLETRLELKSENSTDQP